MNEEEEHVIEKIRVLTEEEIETLYYLIKLFNSDDILDCNGCAGDAGCC